MTIHPQAKAVQDGNAWAGLDPEAVGVVRLREMMNRRLVELAGEAPAVARVEDRVLPGEAPVPVRIYWPAGAPAPGLPVFVYLHSGGYCVYDIATADPQCRTIANDAGCIVVSVGYRLAPEAKFPAAVEDAWAALAWLGEDAGELGGDASRLAIGGESCGGTLATVCALTARERGFPALRQVVLVCALLQMGAPDPAAPRTLASWMREQYLRGPEDAADFRASPLLHPDLSRLPPHLVITAEHDGLRGQGEAYAKALEKAGTPVVHRDFAGMIHNFTGMAGAIDDARLGHALIADTLRGAFSRAAVPA